MNMFHSKWLPTVALLFAGLVQLPAQVQPSIPAPDSRYKADILVIIAHPDDDTAVSTYLAEAVFDEGKRVAVIFTTRGNSGPNAVGMEQSKALADVREMEARRSLAARGITNVWFLRGQDTPTQDVLHSLETVGHGTALEETVRLIRLTRPEVILTWMPAYVAGENHGDHQASGVIAVEGFDLAGNPTVFPEQVEAPRQHAGIANWGEGLHPWQAKKLYFFSDASHPEFLKGHGPTYLATDISRTKKVSFAEINRLAWKQYATQVDFDDQVLSYYVNMPEYLILGKSLVHAPTDADVWTGIGDKPIAYVSMPQFKTPVRSGISLTLGGPWSFYREFYPVHGLTALENLVPPQTALSADRQLWVPLLLRNDSNASARITLHANLPAGWTGDTKDRVYRLEPGNTYPVEIFLTAPADSKEKSPQMLSWTVTQDGVSVGTAGLSVYLEYNDVPQ
ncbi:MAG: PIG-L family deacetylase [Acidobacteriaceae bacterium]